MGGGGGISEHGGRTTMLEGCSYKLGGGFYMRGGGACKLGRSSQDGRRVRRTGRNILYVGMGDLASRGGGRAWHLLWISQAGKRVLHRDGVGPYQVGERMYELEGGLGQSGGRTFMLGKGLGNSGGGASSLGGGLHEHEGERVGS